MEDEMDQLGAYGRMQTMMSPEQLYGAPEVTDILGWGQEDDWMELEYPGAMAGLGDDMDMGGMPMSDPMSPEGGDQTEMYQQGEARDLAQELLQQKAQKRLAASEAFQSSASKMFK